MQQQTAAQDMEVVACDLCGSRHTQFVLRQRDLIHEVSPKEFDVVRCVACGLMYLNPRPTIAEIGRYYPEQYFTPSPTKSRTEIERTAKRWSGHIKRWIMEDFYGYPSESPRGPLWFLRKLLLWPEKIRRVWRGKNILPWIGEGRLLDVGCGPGVNLQTFQEQGWDVHGIEMSQAAAAQAKARVGDDRIHVGILATAPFPPESFDVIVLSHSLEHLFNPTEELARVRRLLKPTGRLVIAVPNADSLESRVFGRWWVPWDPPRHLYHFGKTTLTKLLERSGFQVVRLRTGVGTMFFMVSLDRLWMHTFKHAVPLRRVIEKLIAKPFCLAAGHLGYGTEITVYAAKAGREG